MVTGARGRAAALPALLALAVAAAGAAWSAGTGGMMLEMNARRREAAVDGTYGVREQRLRWKPAETAVIVCDMWNEHWCKGATRRVAELAPRVDRFLGEARRRGVLIVHAPSSCMEAYKDHPGRRRAEQAPRAANLPAGIEQWCKEIPAEEPGRYPIDQSDGGCDDTPPCASGSPWTRQTAAIEIRDDDAISDSGTEIWNLFEQRGIRNVTRFGKNTLLVRDLTDTMYNSRARPFVSHFRGTELIVEHVEKFVCPSITSDQLLGGAPFRFKEDRP
jgi:nicotinamidase-related amidase